MASLTLKWCCTYCSSLYYSRNIVSTVTLGCRLDLKKIALHARNAEYNPKVGVAWGVVILSML